MARGSIFRMREIGAEKLRLSLAADVTTPLLVTLETESGSFLEPAFHYESRRRIEGAAALEAPLESRSIESEGTTTVVVLERPSGLLPSRLLPPRPLARRRHRRARSRRATWTSRTRIADWALTPVERRT